MFRFLYGHKNTFPGRYIRSCKDGRCHGGRKHTIRYSPQQRFLDDRNDLSGTAGICRTKKKHDVLRWYHGTVSSKHPFKNAIDLQDLSQWSLWPARLIGLETFSTEKRTIKKMEREYNKDKYGACLEYLSTHPHATPEDLKWFELGQDKT